MNNIFTHIHAAPQVSNCAWHHLSAPESVTLLQDMRNVQWELSCANAVAGPLFAGELYEFFGAQRGIVTAVRVHQGPF